MLSRKSLERVEDHMKYRKLRMAWSVGWGIVAVLIAALWFRSCWNLDQLMIAIDGTAFNFESGYGELEWDLLDTQAAPNVSGWQFNSFEGGASAFVPRSGFFAGSLQGTIISLIVPNWFSVLTAIVFGLFPWLPFNRFSLRTLLVATTLVAVVLGLIVYAVRS